MVKTEVQLPDMLYREARRLAEENRISFTELVRRGVEEFLQHHPRPVRTAGEWRPPTPKDLGQALAPEVEWTPIVHE